MDPVAALEEATGLPSRDPPRPRSSEPPPPASDEGSKGSTSSKPIVAQGSRFDKVPEALRGLKAWLVWKFEQHDGEAKPRKVPYYVAGGRRHGVQGSDDDCARLVSFEDARKAVARRGFDGVGLALLPGSGITALDFDRCVDDSGQVRDEVLEAVVNTYAEVSPSGRGVRAFVRGELGNRKHHGEPFGFELFGTKGFVTVTGDALPHVEQLELVADDVIASPSPALLDMIAARFGTPSSPEPIGFLSGNPKGTCDSAPAPPLGLMVEQIQGALSKLNPSIGYEGWLRVGMALHHETRGSGEGLRLWSAWSSTSSKYPGHEALEAKWSSFGRGDQRPVTLRSLAMLDPSGSLAAMVGAAETDATAEDFDVVGSEGERPLKFKAIQAAEFAARPPPRWIVPGVLPQAELAVIFGASGSGKSFFAFDLAASIALGVPWRGLPTQQGRVVYIAAEGAAGMTKRLRAYATHSGNDLARMPLHVIADAPSLLGDDDRHLAETVRVAGGADLIVVDTLAQVTAGANENSGEDMGKVLAHCKRLHAATGALVVLIHHSGKDESRGARGWSGVRAAVDAEIEISSTDGPFDRVRKVRVSKQKDGEDGLEFGFKLVSVPLGYTDNLGALATSCVVQYCDAPPGARSDGRGRRQGRWEGAVLRAVTDLVGLGAETVAVEAVITRASEAVPHDAAAGRDRRREYLLRALKGLVDQGDLLLVDNTVVMPHAA